MDEVRQDQSLLKGELNKAQSVVEAMNSASPRLALKKFQQPLNRPRHLHISGENSFSFKLKSSERFHYVRLGWIRL